MPSSSSPSGPSSAPAPFFALDATVERVDGAVSDDKRRGAEAALPAEPPVKWTTKHTPGRVGRPRRGEAAAMPWGAPTLSPAPEAMPALICFSFALSRSLGAGFSVRCSWVLCVVAGGVLGVPFYRAGGRGRLGFRPFSQQRSLGSRYSIGIRLYCMNRSMPAPNRTIIRLDACIHA